MRVRAVVVAAALLAAGVVTMRGGDDAVRPAVLAAITSASPSPATDGSATHGGVDWVEVVAELDAARASAFADPADAEPATWAAEHCACHAVDASALTRLTASGRRLTATTPTLVAVDVVAAADLAVTLRITDTLAPYAEVDDEGRVLAEWPGRGEREWEGLLVRTEAGWRWSRIGTAPTFAQSGVDPGASG